MTDREQIEEKLIQIFTEECIDVLGHGGCIIHFPEIEIRNKNGETKNITDLYVKLSWKWGNNDNVENFFTGIYGTRMSYTPEDIYHGYAHSHLSPVYDPDADNGEEEGPVAYTEFNDFCLGSGDLYKTLAGLTIQFSIEQFTILLYSIDDFVRWESLDGGPYITMDNISKNNNTFQEIYPIDTAPFYVKDKINAFYEIIPEEFLKEITFFHDDLNTTINISEELVEIWEDLDLYNFKDVHVPTYKHKKRYYVKNRSSKLIQELAETIDLPDSILFKGERIYPEILWETNDDKLEKEILEDHKIVPHPGVLPKILELTEEKLHTYLKQEDTWTLTK